MVIESAEMPVWEKVVATYCENSEVTATGLDIAATPDEKTSGKLADEVDVHVTPCVSVGKIYLASIGASTPRGEKEEIPVLEMKASPPERDDCTEVEAKVHAVLGKLTDKVGVHGT